MISSLNHITLAVSDINRSVKFYKDILGFEGHVVWDQGAYFSVGSLWLCLSVDPPCEKTDYTHIAFTVDPADFKSCCQSLLKNGVEQWKDNSSE
ncbi:MAG: VOC family protein, partial [Granulosicoccus sp.]|nr:VOC family protein [Granulosicoccus sp.]